MFSSDDFPDPDAPRTATNSPASMRNDTSRSACTGAPLPRRCVLDTCFTSIMLSSRFNGHVGRHIGLEERHPVVYSDGHFVIHHARHDSRLGCDLIYSALKFARRIGFGGE